MTNDEFQKKVLDKLDQNDQFQRMVLDKLNQSDEFQKQALTRFSQLEQNMATKDDVVGIETKLSSLETKIDKLAVEGQKDIFAMLQHVSEKTEAIPRMEATLNRIAAIQATQGESINILALRQLQTEAELAALKKAK